MKYLLLILLMCCCQGYGQKSDYLKKLGIKDSTSLVIKSGVNLDNDNSLKSFLVVSDDSTMDQFGVFQVNGNQFIRKHSVSEAEKYKINQVLKNIATIDESKLNIIKNGNGEEIYTPDGLQYEVLIYKNDEVKKYSTYAPEVFIEREYPGYEERKKLMDIVKALDFRNTIATTDIDAVKKADAIYIKRDDAIKEVIDKGGSLDIATEIFLINATGRTEIVKENSETFLQKQRNKVVDLDFFLKYGSNLMFLKSKKIFLVDGEQDVQTTLKEVKVLMLPTM